jgi:Zn-dependent protease with chaperone function
MNREFVLAILVVLLCGSALTVAGWCPTGSPVVSSGRLLERRTWLRMWAPFGPAVIVFAALCGWALVEPKRAEPVPTCLLWATLPFGAVMTRAAWRALWSLAGSHQDLAVATAGFFRPRIIVSPRIAETLDQHALAAAFAHERAHARHRDPLRLWLAQLGSDFLWPWPAANWRFLCWRQALELARDEEARLSGVTGPDLAAAILASFRCSRGRASSNAAALGGDESFVEERIARLMRPLETETPQANKSVLWLFALAGGAILAVLLGSEFGERVVGTLLAVV